MLFPKEKYFIFFASFAYLYLYEIIKLAWNINWLDWNCLSADWMGRSKSNWCVMQQQIRKKMQNVQNPRLVMTETIDDSIWMTVACKLGLQGYARRHVFQQHQCFIYMFYQFNQLMNLRIAVFICIFQWQLAQYLVCIDYIIN